MQFFLLILLKWLHIIKWREPLGTFRGIFRQQEVSAYRCFVGTLTFKAWINESSVEHSQTANEIIFRLK